MLVAVVDISADGSFQVADAPEGATSEPAGGEIGEEALDEVEP